MSAPTLGKVGIWAMQLRFHPNRAEAIEAAAELETLGYGALWVPGGIDDKVLDDLDVLLDATRTITLATGIINVWKNPAAQVAAWYKGQSPERQARLMLGIGVSHSPLIGDAWTKISPLKQMRDYCDGLDAGGMPQTNTCIAALGPKMVELSGERTAGTHPYLVPPAHSAVCREILGPGKLVAPEQGVVVSSDPAIARAAARHAVDHYRALPNYRNNWHRLGIADADIDAMSDSFIDTLFAWGTPAQIAERVKAHHDAGADHVCLQVVPTDEAGGLDSVREDWRKLAGALL